MVNFNPGESAYNYANHLTQAVGEKVGTEGAEAGQKLLKAVAPSLNLG
jgi:hypothetical protein